MQLNILRTEVRTEVSSNTNKVTDLVNNIQHNYQNNKSRGWMITINNPTQDDVSTLWNDDYQYCIWQFERGADGTVHIQGFIYYTNPRIWPKRKYPRAHLEPAKNFNACKEYCSKLDTRVQGPYERGTPPEQGRRSDLESAATEYLQMGESAFADVNPSTFIRFHKGLRELAQLKVTHRDRSNPPTVIWYYGSAGAGKSRMCVERHPESFYIKDGTSWWNGYTQQEAIIIDDFDGRWPYRDLLRLLDRYPYQGQIKGGYVKINSPYIYITCEHPPEHWWDGNELAQVTRRLTQIELIGDTYIPPEVAFKLL